MFRRDFTTKVSVSVITKIIVCDHKDQILSLPGGLV